MNIGRQLLERLGYQVETKMSSVEALALFRFKPDQFDLIIADMTMPHITGNKLAKEILSIRPDMAIIFCTGFSEKIDEDKARDWGIRALAMKPIDKRGLAQTVRKVLDEI